jgi:hypothetical protein
MCSCNSRISTVVTNLKYARDSFHESQEFGVDGVKDCLAVNTATFPIHY